MANDNNNNNNNNNNATTRFYTRRKLERGKNDCLTQIKNTELFIVTLVISELFNNPRVNM